MKHSFSGIIVRYIRNNDAPETTDVLPEDELHVNLWEVARRRFIDLGVMISQPAEITTLQVDLPWEINHTKVFDLGSRLVGEKIIAAIFNDVVQYRGSNDQMFAQVTFPNAITPRSFVLARLSSQDFISEQVVLSDGSRTTRLKVRVPPLPNFSTSSSALYIRFRIIDVPEENYTSVFSQKDRNLLSSSLETRIVDFRINVRRGTPDDILTSQTNLRFPRWKKIHVFMTLDRTREMTFSNEKFVDCRSLEDEAVWNSYIALDTSVTGSEGSVSDYLGYQWTSKSEGNSPAKDLVALVRFSKVTSSKAYVLRFILLALILGAGGNGVWNIAEEIVPKILPSTSKNWAILGILAVFFTAIIYVPPIVIGLAKGAATLSRKIWSSIQGWF